MRARTRLSPLLARLSVYAAAVLVVLYAPGHPPAAPAAAEAAALYTAPPARARSRPLAPAPSGPPAPVRIALLAVLAAGIALELGTRRPAWR